MFVLCLFVYFNLFLFDVHVWKKQKTKTNKQENKKDNNINNNLNIPQSLEGQQSN